MISETDEEPRTDSDDGVDVAEQATLPYVEHAECDATKLFSKDLKRVENEFESTGDKTLKDSDDEALQVIRDIFFS